MRVAIDIRRAGNFGIGTYIRNIVNQLRAPTVKRNIY